LKRVTNPFQLFPGALVFDKWTCNCDGRQVIFYRAGEDDGLAYSACLIDQGFCFNDGEWSFPDSPIRSIYPRRLVYDQVRGLSSFEPFLSTLENIERAQLEACARDIPMEWCGDKASQLDQLVEGLFERRLKVRQALIEARDCFLKPFPNWN